MRDQSVLYLQVVLPTPSVSVDLEAALIEGLDDLRLRHSEYDMLSVILDLSPPRAIVWRGR